MISGISEKEEKIIKGILKKYPYEFFYYGSRVKGDFTKSSDLDILVQSKEKLADGVIEKIELEFNESLIPYIVKLTNGSDIEEYFYNLISPTLVKIEC